MRMAILAALAVAIAGQDAIAAPRGACPGGDGFAAQVVALGGAVAVEPPGAAPFVPLRGDGLCPGDLIRTGDTGRVELQFEGADTTVGVSRNASVRLPAAGAGGANLRLESGVMRFISSVRGYFAVETTHANAGIDGTEAVLALDRPGGVLAVLVVEGQVTLSAADAALVLAQGTAGLAGPDLAPRIARQDQAPGALGALLADPAGATDWAIYYPPILLGAGGAVGAAAARLEAGDPDGALALMAGQTSAGALGLASLIASLRGQPDRGAALAARAVATDPDFAPARIAQSYADQAQGDIPTARAAAERAVALAPDDPYAAARLGELTLIEGDRAGAIAAAEAAIALGPTALGQAVLGLARLASNDTGAARAAFDAAIALDSRAPLGHLGSGLALIRQGDIAAGRRALELAAALDPRRAATRSWLGRAYATEGLPEKAAAQFDLAKTRDPDDPTPWLLNAQELYAANRPVDALEELVQAERLGDRATLRGASGLAEDRAVQSGALGRILGVLGFDQLAQITGAQAAEQDPTNPAAQRLYADSLQQRQGRDIARGSALLAAQVYEGPSKTPLEAGQTDSGLSLLASPGAARASFGEFAPFFDGDGVAAYATGALGSQGTRSDTTSFAALSGPVSLGVSQFHYQTDGFRANNDIRHDVVALQVKAEATPGLDVFTELRYRNSVGGDRILEFDEVADDPTLRTGDERTLLRTGAHFDWGAHHDFALVGTYVRQTADENRPGFFAIQNVLDRDALELQGQHVGRWGDLSLLSGFSLARIQDESTTDAFFGSFTSRSRTEAVTLYSYANLRLDLLAGAEITAGLSYDAIAAETPGLSVHTLNPKLGGRLWLTPDLGLRAAYTETVKPAQLLDQRLEPVSIAGFEQYFDETQGTELHQFGLGLDWHALPNLWLGFEGSQRELDQPVGNADPVGTDIRGIRGYANATFGPDLAASLSVSHDRATSTDPFDLQFFANTEVRGRLAWFHPQGGFASVDLGYVWHSAVTNVDQSDQFPILEATLGWRLPNKRGVLSLHLQNVLDESFGFQDRRSNALGAPFQGPRYARDFAVVAQATLAF